MNSITNCSTGIATILSCKQIAQSFSENIYELSIIRRNWSSDYAESLKDRIEEVLKKHFTPELLMIHLENHSHLHDLLIAFLKDISVFRAELKVDFRYDKPFLKDVFEKLGYSDYFSDAKNGDHYSLYKLMECFSKNMDTQLRLVITARGIENTLISRISSYYEKLSEFKDCFDFNDDSDLLDSEAKKQIHSIYNEIKNICRIAMAYYQFDPIQQSKFNFYKVLINIKASMGLFNV